MPPACLFLCDMMSDLKTMHDLSAGYLTQDGGVSKTNNWTSQLGKKSKWNNSRDFMRFCHVPVETCPISKASQIINTP